MRRNQSTLRFGLIQSNWVRLYIFGLIFTSMRVYIMRVEVSSVDKTSIYGVGVASAVVFERRFSEIGGEGTVGDPSGSLLELNDFRCTC
jgi:hypothetical protein